MESQNLRTASVYINNLLLSRGLLRNGKPLEFAKPSKEEGGTEATMAKVINLVHDMILRRDREADQRESLAMTIRNLRSTETKSNLEIERLRTRNAECDRQLSIALGQERAFKATLRTAENSAKSLREEMHRLRTMLQQVRTQCANDIRKRDVQIQRLKSHLTSQQRGARAPLSNSTIVVTPSGISSTSVPSKNEAANPLESSDYSLKQETTEFLTQLSQNLCDENDNLIGLVRASLSTLRTLQGAQSETRQMSQDGPPGSEEESPAFRNSGTNLMQSLPSSYETLATEMEEVLENLRTILTNPSFVPLEEVEVREDEIIRLREGWEKMEGRWREAVALMDGWRKRMANGGSLVNLEELKLGLELSPVRVGVRGPTVERDNGDSIDNTRTPTDEQEHIVDTEKDEDRSIIAIEDYQSQDDTSESDLEEINATEDVPAESAETMSAVRLPTTHALEEISPNAHHFSRAIIANGVPEPAPHPGESCDENSIDELESNHPQSGEAPSRITKDPSPSPRPKPGSKEPRSDNVSRIPRQV
ncbi:MAG: hypothetical protein M1837_000593 [Sclerophora amabilis]|nr:MAG: hypothetical protein M1837_000593 [Sclerophora amabilis]